MELLFREPRAAVGRETGKRTPRMLAGGVLAVRVGAGCWPLGGEVLAALALMDRGTAPRRSCPSMTRLRAISR